MRCIYFATKETKTNPNLGISGISEFSNLVIKIQEMEGGDSSLDFLFARLDLVLEMRCLDSKVQFQRPNSRTTIPSLDLESQDSNKPNVANFKHGS